MKVKVMPMEECSWCGGHGLRMSGEWGDVIECSECGGGGIVEKRDEKGRFVKWEEVDVPDD